MATDSVERLARVLSLWCTISACTVGCNKSPDVAPVRGSITLEGEPIGPGNIVFVPAADEATKRKAASGTFESDGQYSLTTYHSGDGAFVGTHAVVITPRAVGVEPGGEVAIRNAELPPIPKRYGRVKTSPLTAVVRDDTNTIDFELTSEP